MRKGVSMPISAIALLAISFVVVIVLLASFILGVGSKTTAQDMNSFITQHCFRLKTLDNCGLKDCYSKGIQSITETISRYRAVSTVIEDRRVTLEEACRRVYGTSDVLQCCGCRSMAELQQECSEMKQSSQNP